MTKYEVVKEFVNQIYNEAEGQLSKYKSVCRNSCSHCCCQPIETVNWEMFNMVEYIKNEIDSEIFKTIQQNIKSWAIFFNKYFPDTRDVMKANRIFRDAVTMHKIPCPFLISDSCSIYPIRPLVCRVHLMESEPKKCKNNPLRQPPNHIGIIGHESFNRLTSAPNSFVNYLPIMLLIDFKLSTELFKPHVYTDFG